MLRDVGECMSEKPEVIIVHESITQSWATDASTYALFAALIGTGWLLDSQAMQWVGAIIGFVAILARGSARVNSCRCTIPEARAKLDRLEAIR